MSHFDQTPANPSTLKQALDRSEERFRHTRVVFVLGAAGAYILVFIAFYSRLGPGLAELGGLPVIAAGWLLGLHAGLVAWFLFLLLNMLLFNMVGLPGWDTVFRNGGGLGTLVTIIVVVVAGRLRDLREQMKREIVERKQVEESLKQTHEELERRVEQRTTEHGEINRKLSEEIEVRKRTEQAMRRSEARFSAFMQHLPGVAFMKDAQGRHIYANHAFEKLFELERDDWYGKTNDELFPKDVAATFNEHDRIVMQERRDLQCSEVTGHDDQVRHWVVHKFPITDDREIPVMLGGVAIDITARKLAEEEARAHLDALAHVSRLSTMGEMATGMSHELNQPLAAISIYSFVGKQTLEESAADQSEKLRDLFEKLSEQSSRAGDIIHRLQDLVRKTKSVPKPVEMTSLVETVLGLFESEIREGEFRVERNLRHSSPEVFADEIQIQQVLVNLIRNALEAMRDTPNDRKILEIGSCDSEEGMVEISVSDSGKGISPDDEHKIFDAFFSTKPEGMGMGLAISRSIVESHAGHLTMTRNEGCGITFRMTLPFAKETNHV